MSDMRKNILIGSFIVAALCTVSGMVLFIRPTIGNGEKTLHVRFSDIAGISLHTRVAYAGKPIGEVKMISPVQDFTVDEIGRRYCYELLLKVDSSVDVFEEDQIALQTSGLLGERSIGITPKSHASSKVVNDKVLYASSLGNLEKALGKIADVSAKVDDWFSKNSSEISRLVHSCSRSVSLLEEALCQVKEENMVKKAGSILDQVSTSTESLARITGEIEAGKGTLGKILKGDDFYQDLHGVLSKTNTLLNDINHYGLLFQYDKGWQRTRTKRASTLAALKSPEQFKDYFETELSAINTSLSRLAILVQKNDTSSTHKEDFKKGFVELSRKVDQLSSDLKTYNEDLVDNKEK